MTEYELMLKRAVEEALKPYLEGLVDDAVKGLLRSIGDAGETPTNIAGRTILSLLSEVHLDADVVRDSLEDRTAYDKSTAAALSVTLYLATGRQGRSYIEVGVRSSSSGDFYVEGSHNSVRWWLVDTITVAANVDEHRGYLNAFPYVRVRTDLVADNEIVIVSSR